VLTLIGQHVADCYIFDEKINGDANFVFSQNLRIIYEKKNETEILKNRVFKP
jgi:hypothetical protein